MFGCCYQGFTFKHLWFRRSSNVVIKVSRLNMDSSSQRVSSHHSIKLQLKRPRESKDWCWMFYCGDTLRTTASCEECCPPQTQQKRERTDATSSTIGKESLTAGVCVLQTSLPVTVPLLRQCVVHKLWKSCPLSALDVNPSAGLCLSIGTCLRRLL